MKDRDTGPMLAEFLGVAGMLENDRNKQSEFKLKKNSQH